MQEILKQHENILINVNTSEPALDYIVRDETSHTMFYKNSRGEPVHDYVAEEYRRKCTFKLKNAIMVKWLDVKSSKTKLNFDEIIKGL